MRLKLYKFQAYFLVLFALWQTIPLTALHAEEADQQPGGPSPNYCDHTMNHGINPNCSNPTPPTFPTCYGSCVTLFNQPILPGIVNADGSPNFEVPKVKDYHYRDRLMLEAWQANPFESNNLTVPVGWDAGSKTGLTAGNPIPGKQQSGFITASSEQTGFNPNAAYTSTAQIVGDAVGAYINSADIQGGNAPGDNETKMMIAPGYQFDPKGTGIMGQEQIFKYPIAGLKVLLNLQVPTAVDQHIEATTGSCRTYAVMDTSFVQVDNPKNTISYDVVLFDHNLAWTPASDLYKANQDPSSKTYMFDTRLIPESSDYVTIDSSSELEQANTWSGYKKFDYTITYANFQAALQELAKAFPGQNFSLNPSDYLFTSFHLNAEGLFGGCPTNNPNVQLGWSMRGQQVLWLHDYRENPGP